MAYRAAGAAGLVLGIIVDIESKAHHTKAQHRNSAAKKAESARNMWSAGRRTHPIAIKTPTTHGQKNALRTGGSMSGIAAFTHCPPPQQPPPRVLPPQDPTENDAGRRTTREGENRETERDGESFNTAQ